MVVPIFYWICDGRNTSHFVGDWAYRDIDLSFGRLTLIILPTLALVMAIALILPHEPKFPLNLREHYFEYAPKASRLFGIGILLSVIPDLLPGVESQPQPWIIVAFIVPIGLMAFLRNAVVHGLSQAVLWMMLLLQMLGLTSFGDVQ